MEIYPGEVAEFPGVEAEVQYERIVRIRNLSAKSARVRISKFPKFSYFAAKLKSLTAVAPNLYVDVVVTFRFRSHELMPNVLEDELELKLEGGPTQTVKLVARKN